MSDNSNMTTIFVYPNPSRDKGLKITAEIIKIISSSGLEPILPDSIELFSDLVRQTPLEEGVRESDMVISIGGDGTILQIAKVAAKESKPVLGINAGKLGFLAELEKDELSRLEPILKGSYSIDNRSMLDALLMRDGEVLSCGSALNDAVVTNAEVPRIISLDFWVGDHLIATISGDGVIASTPTGSSAYSLSAGGPLVEPCADLTVVTPICAHSLYAKSFILCGSSEIRFVNTTPGKTAKLTIDGVSQYNMEQGDTVVLTKSELSCKLVRAKNHSFYDIVRNKLLP